MITSTKIASLAVAAMLITTASAQAIDFNADVADSVQDSVNSSESRDIGSNLHDAVDTDEARDANGNLNDRILFQGDSDALNQAILNGDKQAFKVALANGYLTLTCVLDNGALVIANTGALALPAKTKLRWTVATLGETGTLKFATDLMPGAKVRTADLVDGADGETCAIKVLGR